MFGMGWTGTAVACCDSVAAGLLLQRQPCCCFGAAAHAQLLKQHHPNCQPALRAPYSVLTCLERTVLLCRWSSGGWR